MTTTPSPLSRAAQAGTGWCLLGAGLTNGLGQYAGELAMPDLEDLSAQIAWGAEVLALVAQGLTNRQIAEQLFISSVTARNHVSRVLTELDLDNRTQAAAWMARSRVEG